jgi:threonine dehydratase
MLTRLLITQPPHCADCGAALDYRKAVKVDTQHRSICDGCAKKELKEKEHGR